MSNYDPSTIEKKWQQRWEESGLYATPENADHANKQYILPQLPYPSGAGLHVGHAEVYAACDIHARYQRMQGKDVLQVLGWDSFGLPAENYAIKTNVHPRISTETAIDNFRDQIKSLGISVDWDREVGSHQPNYYKWTQWFFLLMLKRGLAYRKEQSVNWCPKDKTVLANEQTVKVEIDGTPVSVCERCDTPVEQRSVNQWFFKITEYADRLIEDLDKVDWPAETIKRQRDWIGRSEGAKIQFEVQNSKTKDPIIEVFTTRSDTFYGATFLVLAPDGPYVQENLDSFPNEAEVREYVKSASFKTELERQSDRSKTGVDTGLVVLNPFSGKEIPVYVSDFVLGSFGTGSVAGVPGSDERDFEFAQEKNLPIIRVIVGEDGSNSPITTSEDIATEGTMVNSDFLDGVSTEEAKDRAIEYAEEKGFGERTVTYKLRDWSVSRQRFWGSPIPVVYDPEGNPHPVDEDDLPVMLPEDVDFTPTGESPLTQSVSFQEGVEEKYGKGWKREMDTLDTFVCSSWYFFRYLDPHNDDAFASKEALETWMPVDFYLGGPEHVNGHLLYSRFFTKVLFDEGLISFDEPFLKHRHQGTIWGSDGRIMSKRYGNVVNPTDVVNEYGADTLRMYEMFLGPLEASKPWNTEGIKGITRFLTRVAFLNSASAGTGIDKETARRINEVTPLMEDLKFNVVIARLMESLKSYEQESPSRETWEAYLKMLAPFAPHLTEELWERVGNTSSIHSESWPVAEEVVPEDIHIIVQIDGKKRASFTVPADKAQDRSYLEEHAHEAVGDRLDKVTVVKTIVVPGRLVNVVTS